MILILNIETSTKNCSISLAKNGMPYFVIEEYSEYYSHAEKIHCFISYAIEANLFKFSELHAVCINKGPGSSTGIKIGLAVAKGLCYGLKKPLLFINYLNNIIEKTFFKKGIIISNINIKYQIPYQSIYDENKFKITPFQINTLKKKIFQEYNKYKIFILENGARITKYFIKTPVYIISNLFPSSQNMAFLSYKYLVKIIKKK